MPSVSEEIQSDLDAVQRQEDVAVCLAVESGSRAWGFASADSDYDVRFIYVHRAEWYLSIESEGRRDVVERPLHHDIDLSGWDIRKALRLFHKSNPPLLEWLQCPIVYRERSSLAARLRSLVADYHSPAASYYHYLHMARNNLREYLQGETVWRKKYFYALRPLLAMLWIERGLGPVPIEFGRLVWAVVEDRVVRRAIDDLLAEKRAGAELDRGPRIEPLSHFIRSEMARLEGRTLARPGKPISAERLDRLFRDVLREVWSSEENA